MKEVYQKLRDEHVSLIRSKAEVERAADGERAVREALETTLGTTDDRLADTIRVGLG